MKTLRAVLCLILAMLMLMTAGCANGDNDTPGASDSGSPSETPAEFSKGVISDTGVYTSEFAGFSFEPPSGWTVLTEEEITQMMEAGSSSIGEDMESINLTTVYDYMAMNENGASNVMIMYEDTTVTNSSDITEEEYSDIVIEGLLELDMGYVKGETGSIKIGGNDCYTSAASIDLGESITLEQGYIYRKIGDHMLCICVTTSSGLSDSELSFDDIVKMFK